jgi:hypothetical protein
MAGVCKILGFFMWLIMKQNPFEIATKNTLPHSVKYSTFSQDNLFSSSYPIRNHFLSLFITTGRSEATLCHVPMNLQIPVLTADFHLDFHKEGEF